MDYGDLRISQEREEAVMTSFNKAGKAEGINFAKDFYTRVENPFDQKRAVEKII